VWGSARRDRPTAGWRQLAVLFSGLKPLGLETFPCWTQRVRRKRRVLVFRHDPYLVLALVKQELSTPPLPPCTALVHSTFLSESGRPIAEPFLT
jgi:hypothetical protein